MSKYRQNSTMHFNYIGCPLVCWAAICEPNPSCLAWDQEPIWPYHSPVALLVKILIIKFHWLKKLRKMKPFWTECLKNCCIHLDFQKDAIQNQVGSNRRFSCQPISAHYFFWRECSFFSAKTKTLAGAQLGSTLTSLAIPLYPWSRQLSFSSHFYLLSDMAFFLNFWPHFNFYQTKSKQTLKCSPRWNFDHVSNSEN